MGRHIELLHADVTSRIIASCFEVNRLRGYGFLEVVYKRCVAIELELRGSQVRREVPVAVDYKGIDVGAYRIDMLVDTCVILEIKTQLGISDANIHQLMNYQRASGIAVGMLFNFGPTPSFVRRIYSVSKQSFFDHPD